MLRRKLGAGGPVVSAIGIGAMSFAGVYGNATEEEAHAVLDAAVDAGVDHIDTSNVYGMGRSEEMIGSFLNRYRDHDTLPFKIATKASITTDADGNRAFDNSAEHLESELDGSLLRLGIEQVDLFYVHRRDPRFEIEEVTGTLAGLIAKGKIAAFGFSEIAPTSLARASAVHDVAAVQSEYSLQTRLPELGLIDACEAQGSALVAFSPVGRGLLTDRPPNRDRVEASGFLKTNPRFAGGNLERNVAASETLREFAAEIGVPAASLAIAWVLDQSPMMHAIPGTRSVEHLGELIIGASMEFTSDMAAELAHRLPVGWCHGGRYSQDQTIGPESYC